VTELLQQLINGLALGAIYALIALGYTMVYGVLRFINFAHSDVFMVGAFSGYFLAQLLPGAAASAPSVLLGILVLFGAMGICALLGMVIEKLAYRPLRGRSTLTVLITAIGVSLLLQNLGQKVFGPNPRSFPALFPVENFQVGGLVIASSQILVFVVTVVLMLALRHIVLHTRVGTAMRALSFNPTAASLMGINNGLIISFTFAIGSAMAAAGGILYASNYPAIDPLMGTLPGMKAFVAAVLGGIGNIAGAAFGGLVLGLVETAVVGLGGSTYRDAVAFAVLILILLLRPEGLLGKRVAEKV
jgi:branched-chain amino acid transport system permease protein